MNPFKRQTNLGRHESLSDHQRPRTYVERFNLRIALCALPFAAGVIHFIAVASTDAVNYLYALGSLVMVVGLLFAAVL